MVATKNAKRALPVMFLAAVLAIVLAGPASVTEVAAQGRPGGQTPKCENTSVSTFFRDFTDDSVKSDGLGSYPGTVNCDNDTNNFYLQTQSGRGLVFQLTNPSDGGSFTLVTDAVAANLGARIPDPGGMHAMAVGETAAASKVQFNFSANGKKYWVSWGSDYPGTTAASVTRTETGWVIEAGSDYIARLRECPATGNCRNPVDRFFFAAVQMDLLAN